ncbi:MAG TPA: MFS transporter [Solirubrobacterales bacterium]|nr:MFS transporter [Solirubrobacterales bacterium]
MQATTTYPKTARNDRRRWIALVILCLGQLMIVLDATIVNVALPSIQGDLHFTQANLTWVINAYLIAFGSFLLLAGRLGDLVGRKKVFIGGLALFTAASTICGIANSEALLICARFVQGIGGAVASSVIIAIIVTEFPEPREQAKALGVFAFVASAGGSIGLLAGGVLTHAINWHWIFFINVPIGILAIALGLVLVEENEGAGLRQGVDVVGSVLITAAMMLGVYTIVETDSYGWGSLHTLGLGAVALVMIGAFLAYEGRIRNPIMPLRVLRSRSLTGANLVRGFLVIGMFSSFFLGALYLEHVLGYNAVDTGLAFLPMTLSIGVLSVGVTPRLLHRFGPKRTLIPGLAMSFAGLLVFARVPIGADYWTELFPAFLLIGLGAGTSFMPLIALAMSEVPKPDAGLASGLVNVSQQMAAAVGIAVLGTLAASRTTEGLAAGHSPATALTDGYRFAFLIAAGCVAVGIAIAVSVLHSPAPSRSAQAGQPSTEELQIREGLLADEML